ncbi:MAG: HAMP domain-containing histidine kinase [Ignavibacteriae bacterium]|nr:HAMP domain-containing histidine kinase [Ignavibacteriota bacterium]
MTSRLHIRPSVLVVIIALLVLVPLLAVLQYQWIGQISEQERERMQATVQTAAFHFSRSVDEELSSVLRIFGADPRRAHADLSFEMAMRLQEWEAQTRHPNLVRQLTYVRRDETGATVWPFDGMQFKQGTQAPDNEFPVDPSRDSLHWLRIRIDQVYAVYVAKNLGSVILPLGENGAPVLGNDRIVLTIDTTYLREQFIPATAAMSIRAGEAQDLEYCILRKDDPSVVLYSSLPDRAAIPPNESDVIMGVAMFPPVPLSMIPSVRGRMQDRPERRPDDRGPGDRSPGDRGPGERRPEEWRWPPEPDRRGDSARFGGGPMGWPGRGRDMRREGSILELRIRHRAGSLEAAVNQSRLRNLAVSSGILILMGIALGVLLVTSHRMQQLANSQIAFVAGMSHELRTPIAVLHSAGENLADGVITDPSRVKAYGQMIRSEVQRLSVLAENALGYAGIHSGRKQYTLVPTQAADVVTRSVSACQPMLMEAGVTVETQLPGVPVTIRADATSLGTAIQNLISNAMKYRGTSERIRVGLRIASGAKSDEVLIDVEDHGIGIDPAEIGRIFEPFYRTEDARTQQIRGSGLGLNLAQHVVQAHGGMITVESTPGHGSCFTIHLPLFMSERTEA